jgi:hypothetical protein
MRFHRFTASKPFYLNGEWQVQVCDHWRLLAPDSRYPVFFPVPLEEWIVENRWHNIFIVKDDEGFSLEVEKW